MGKRHVIHSPSPRTHTTTGEALGLVDGAVPTRSWKPGKVWAARDGIFPKCPKCLNTFAPFESSLEAIAHVLLSVDNRIQKYVCQPSPLHYWMPNGGGGQDKREYTPDFIALTTDERLLVIDAKAARFANHPKWTSREPYIRRAYRRDHDAELIVWTERELHAEPRLSNARTMYRHRFAPSDPSCDFAVIEKLEKLGGTSSIGEICESLSIEFNIEAFVYFGAIMRGALNGLLQLDTASEYSGVTPVRFAEDGQ